ncbi:zf-CCHC domain-containing protein [Tanacetum coccineum]
MEKDFEIYRGKKERVKSIALKAKKESSDDETLTSRSDDEEYAMAKGKSDWKCLRCGDPNHLIDDCPKPSLNKDQKAFIGGSWSDSENDAEDKTNDETCLMAQSSNEITLNSSYYSDNASSLDNDSMQIEYDSLCEISLKIINKNKILKTKRDILEKEIFELNEKIKKFERSKEIEIACGRSMGDRGNKSRSKREPATRREVETGAYGSGGCEQPQCMEQAQRRQGCNGHLGWWLMGGVLGFVGLGWEDDEMNGVLDMGGVRLLIRMGDVLERDGFVSVVLDLIIEGSSVIGEQDKEFILLLSLYTITTVLLFQKYPKRKIIGKVVKSYSRKKNKSQDKLCIATVVDNSTLWHRRLVHSKSRVIQSVVDLKN